MLTNNIIAEGLNTNVSSGYSTKSKESNFPSHSWWEKTWIQVFPKSIGAMWNTNSIIKDLNLGRPVHFLR